MLGCGYIGIPSTLSPRRGKRRAVIDLAAAETRFNDKTFGATAMSSLSLSLSLYLF